MYTCICPCASCTWRPEESSIYFYHSLLIPLTQGLSLDLDSEQKPASLNDVPISACLEAWVTGMCKTPSYIGANSGSHNCQQMLLPTEQFPYPTYTTLSNKYSFRTGYMKGIFYTVFKLSTLALLLIILKASILWLTRIA